MRSALLISILALASYVVAGDVDANDVPSQCKDVCAPVVSLTASCDKKTDDDDTAELNCVCKDPRASKSLPLCDACLTQYGKDGRDNDAHDLVQSCSFTATTYTSTASPSGTSGSSANTTNGFEDMTTTAGSGTFSTGSTGTSTSTPTSNAASKPMSSSNSIFETAFLGLIVVLGI